MSAGAVQRLHSNVLYYLHMGRGPIVGCEERVGVRAGRAQSQTWLQGVEGLGGWGVWEGGECASN